MEELGIKTMFESKLEELKSHIAWFQASFWLPALLEDQRLAFANAVSRLIYWCAHKKPKHSTTATRAQKELRATGWDASICVAQVNFYLQAGTLIAGIGSSL
jgi:hypothetical protein